MLELLRDINWKKLGLIVGFLVICVGVGVLIYYIFFFTPAPAPITKPGEEKIGQLPVGKIGIQPGLEVVAPGKEGLPTTPITKIKVKPEVRPDEIAQGGVTKVIDLDYSKNTSVASHGNELLSYNADTGKLYKVTADGEKTTLSDRVYKDVQKITWSGKNNQAILEFPDKNKILYNYATDKQISLPQDWNDFGFNNEGTQIAFKDMNANPDYRWLGIANADGSGQKYLEQMGDKARDFKVDWSPNGKMIAQYNTGGNAESSKLYFVGQNGENFKSIDLNGYGVETQWTPDGSRLLYSARNTATNNQPQLYIVDAAGDNVGYNHQSLKLNTWADKCAFANATTVYCGVPKQMPDNAGLMPAIADNTPDYIYKVDLQTGVKSFVAEPEYDYTIDKMVVSGDEDALFFTDKLTGNLHTIKLK